KDAPSKPGIKHLADGHQLLRQEQSWLANSLDVGHRASCRIAVEAIGRERVLGVSGLVRPSPQIANDFSKPDVSLRGEALVKCNRYQRETIVRAAELVAVRVALEVCNPSNLD